MVERLFLAVPRGCLRFVIVVFPDHTNLLFSVDFICHKLQIIYVQKHSISNIYDLKLFFKD